MSDSSKDGASAFSRHLQRYIGKKVFFHPHPGNWGDRLIELGALEVLKNTPIRRCDDPGESDVIVINGGGCFNMYWSGALVTTHELREKYPNTPVVVGPQTFSLEDSIAEPFSALLKLPGGPLTLFAREEPSFEMVTSFVSKFDSLTSVVLSQDLAFELQGSPWLKERLNECSERHLLVALRADVESPFSVVRWVAWKQRRAQWNNRRIRTIGWKIVRRAVQTLRKPTVTKVVAQLMPSRNSRVVVNRDVSAVGQFEDFLTSVEQSECMVVDRLHSAIYGYLLGKKVALVVNNHYHKIEGVYRLSMAHPGSSVSLYDTNAKKIN